MVWWYPNAKEWHGIVEEPGFLGKNTEAAVQNCCYFEYWLFESVAQNERKKKREKERRNLFCRKFPRICFPYSVFSFGLISSFSFKYPYRRHALWLVLRNQRVKFELQSCLLHLSHESNLRKSMNLNPSSTWYGGIARHTRQYSLGCQPVLEKNHS